MLLYRNTYYGQPSNVDTVKKVSKALLTSSKLRGAVCCYIEILTMASLQMLTQ